MTTGIVIFGPGGLFGGIGLFGGGRGGMFEVPRGFSFPGLGEEDSARMIGQMMGQQGDEEDTEWIPRVVTDETGKKTFILPMPVEAGLVELLDLKDKAGQLRKLLETAPTVERKEEERDGLKMILAGDPEGLKKLCKNCQNGVRLLLDQAADRPLDEEGVAKAIRKLPKNKKSTVVARLNALVERVEQILKRNEETISDGVNQVRQAQESVEARMQELKAGIDPSMLELTDLPQLEIPFDELPIAISRYLDAKAKEAAAATKEEKPAASTAEPPKEEPAPVAQTTAKGESAQPTTAPETSAQ